MVSGELIAFLDSDDAYLPDFICKMVSMMTTTKSDIIVCSYFTCHTSNRIINCKKRSLFEIETHKYSKKDALRGLIEHKFDIGIEMDIDLSAVHSTKAEVNYDSLTGTFSIPDRDNISAPNTNFAFALDEKGIVFIDDSGFVDKTIGSIISSKRWTMPSLERFIYDFLEHIVARDQIILERVDKNKGEEVRKTDLKGVCRSGLTLYML